MEVNPSYQNRESLNCTPEDERELNKIDARFIDPMTGVYLDITALRNSPWIRFDKMPASLSCDESFPPLPDTFEGIPIHVPSNVEAVLIQEYGSKSITSTVFGQYNFNEKSNRWEK